MTLLQPWFLLLVLLVPLALLRRRRPPALPFAPGADGLPRTWRVRLAPLPTALAVLGLLLAATALARPVRRVPIPVSREGIDILLCLDVSSSMTARDLDPARTRLEVARSAAARFAAARPHDRIGLVTFARFSDLRCPPTLDHTALGRILADVRAVEPDSPEDATGIGIAVARAAQALDSAGARSRVVVLLTDGEENVATTGPDEIAPKDAAVLCRALGVRVYAIAAAAGESADTRPVADLAQHTGGAFFEAKDADALGAVYAAIDALERRPESEARFRTEERFAPLLSLALVLLAAARLLRSSLLGVQP